MSLRDWVEVAGVACIVAAAYVVHLAVGLFVAGIVLMVYANFGGDDADPD